MTTLLVHEDAVFENQVVYVTGNAYFDCTFRRCTMVMHGFGGVMTGCTMDSCTWHLDLLVHDPASWDSFLKNAVPAITTSLPRKSPKRKK